MGMDTVPVPRHKQGAIFIFVGEEVANWGRDIADVELLETALVATRISKPEVDSDLIGGCSRSHEDGWNRRQQL